MAKRVCILIPIFNDWTSLRQIFKDFASLSIDPGFMIEFVIVNDGSPEPPPDHFETEYPITIIHLNSNLGHQKAIACGLANIENNAKYECVVIMDGDGQDKPDGILEMLNAHIKFPSVVIAATRGKRIEAPFFKFGYYLFRSFFFLLSGKQLNFGNFSLLPFAIVSRLVYRNELWSHYPATLLKMNLPVRCIPLSRGHRISGKSKMGLTRLLLHGMGAFLVFLDVISIKIVFLSLIMISVSLTLGLSILLVKLFTSLAIPGWTSTILLILFILFMQASLLAFFTLFLYLISQTQKRFIPAIDFSEYILKEEKFELAKT